MKPPYAIGSVPSLSGHAIAYRWRSLPRVRRHRASKPQGSSERVLPWQAGHHGPINMRLSFPHPLLVRSGHVESITGNKKQNNLHTMLFLLTNTLLHCVGRRLTIILAYLQLSSNPRNLLPSTVVCSPANSIRRLALTSTRNTELIRHTVCDKRIIINQFD